MKQRVFIVQQTLTLQNQLQHRGIDKNMVDEIMRVVSKYWRGETLKYAEIVLLEMMMELSEQLDLDLAIANVA
jgi:hypothetical protein